MKAWIIVLMIGLLSVSPVNAKDYGALSNQLQRNLPEFKVIEIFGQPTSTSMTSCGKGDEQFVCKESYYNSVNHGQSVIIFYQSSLCTKTADPNYTSCVWLKDGSGNMWSAVGWTSY
jgi:hypothetical protein